MGPTGHQTQVVAVEVVEATPQAAAVAAAERADIGLERCLLSLALPIRSQLVRVERAVTIHLAQTDKILFSLQLHQRAAVAVVLTT